MDVTEYQDPDVIRAALGERRIAVVGLSANELRASNFVGYYLRRHGYEVLPVNPRETSILGYSCYPSLLDVPQPVRGGDVAATAHPHGHHRLSKSTHAD